VPSMTECPMDQLMLRLRDAGFATGVFSHPQFGPIYCVTRCQDRTQTKYKLCMYELHSTERFDERLCIAVDDQADWPEVKEHVEQVLGEVDDSMNPAAKH
jgi:hypothetical protein